MVITMSRPGTMAMAPASTANPSNACMYVMSFLPLRDAFHYAIMEGHFPYAGKPPNMKKRDAPPLSTVGHHALISHSPLGFPTAIHRRIDVTEHSEHRLVQLLQRFLGGDELGARRVHKIARRDLLGVLRQPWDVLLLDTEIA